jgi:aminoglycoside phosphotransferase (APT) family kinase protein
VPEGIRQDAVTEWFTANVAGVTPPLEFSLISGGHSNLTFGATDANGRRMVLRRPPLHQVLASAHDMGREHRIIAALQGTIPVPPALGFTDDVSVNDAPFYVMEHVDGLIIRTAEDAKALTPQGRLRVSESLIDVLAAIHAVDVDAVGLGDLGRKDAYFERQLKRWQGQWAKSQTRELPVMDDVHDALQARIPTQGPAAIVHGDYRLDNCMVSPDGEVAAVLDWELCTLGDPLADLGLLMVYWSDPGDDGSALGAAPTAQEGFLHRADLLERYAAASGRDLAQIDFYVAFGYWKLAAIIEGVYARYLGGAMGKDRGNVDFFKVQVERLAQQAAAAVERLPA